MQEQSQNMGTGINTYRGDKNLTINDYNFIKTQKFHNFEERTVELSYSDISTIMNECPLCDTVHLLLFKACVCYFLSNFYFFSPNDSPSKTMKNVYFI